MKTNNLMELKQYIQKNMNKIKKLHGENQTQVHEFLDRFALPFDTIVERPTRNPGQKFKIISHYYDKNEIQYGIKRINLDSGLIEEGDYPTYSCCVAVMILR